MKKLILAVSLILVSASAHAEQELGLWERFCLNDKIGDACSKAIKSLSEKVDQADGGEAVNLLLRIQTVSELGCSIHNKASCEWVREFSAEVAEQPAPADSVQIHN